MGRRIETKERMRVLTGRGREGVGGCSHCGLSFCLPSKEGPTCMEIEDHMSD